jgi:hypothetical protein
MGKRPFTIKDAQLCFALSPVLPGEWFTAKEKSLRWKGASVKIPSNCFACTLLGRTLLVYHNQQRKKTFGSDAVRPVRYILDEKEEIKGPLVSEGLAEKIRNCSFKRIDVWLE